MPSIEPGADPRPALCMINYNGSRYLPETLGRVRELAEQFCEIVFVDDASTDDSVKAAKALLPEARIVRLPENRGPGPARNAGVEAVVARRILFIDNDVTLERDTAATLSAGLDLEVAAAMAQPRVVSASNPDHIEYEGGDAHVSGLVALRNAGSSASDASADERVTTVGSLITCAFLLDRDRWGDAPLFDEGLGMYMDDHELGLRARMQGKELVVVPAALCLHGPGTPGISIRETGRHTPVRIRNTILNRWQILLKLYEARTLVLLSPYLVLFELYQIAGCISLGWMAEWTQAVRELVRVRKDLLGRRLAFQRSRRRTDAAVLSAGTHPFNPGLARRAPVRAFLRTLDLAATLNWQLACILTGRSSRGRSSRR